MQLRPYQTEAVNAVYDHLRTRDDNPCVVLPVGTGKSVVLAQIATDAVDLWSGRVLILAHVKELLEQNADKIRALCPHLDIGVYSAGLNSRDTDHAVIVAGIQSVYKRASELGAFDLVIVDECHLIPPDGEGRYRAFLADAKNINPNIRIIGLTATPFRLKGGLICQENNILNHVCYEAGLKEMIAQRYLSPLVSRSGKAEAKLDNLHIRGGEFINSEIEEAMDNDDLVNAACREIVELTKDRQSVLIFTSSVEHCKHVAAKIKQWSGQECAIVTGSTPAAERAEILARFKGEQVVDDFFSYKPRLKFMANVNVLTTGFDAPNIDCIVLLRPTNSPGLLVQMCLDKQTEILTENGWRNWDNLQSHEPVGAFNMDIGRIEFCPVESKIERGLANGESMVEVKAHHLDIRVTNTHDFVFHNRHRTNAKWQKRSAKELKKYKDSFYIPVAANQEGQGLDLTDDEIRFLGWVLTDGCMDEKTLSISISQSVESPYNDHIVSVLDGCGFGYGRYRIKRKGELAKYADIYHYHIPHGQPRGKNKDKRGWAKLFKFFSERILFSLKDISQRQLALMLECMNYANGNKCKKLDYTPRGYRLAIGNHKALADDLQALLIQRGYRCNMSIQKQKTSFHSGEPAEQYLLYVKKQLNATIGGATHSPSKLVKNRCSIKDSDFLPSERVWCVSNRLGTLVTRRNGKIAILGNCGRGTRLHPGKENCLVLDYGENILRHGPIDMITVEDKTPGKGEAPAKKCPECLALIHASYQTCPDCGFEFPLPETSNINSQASTAGILSGEHTDEEFEVMGVSYSPHIKRGADPSHPATMRIDYKTGFYQEQSEWVCPEHTGYARNKFENWWRDRSYMPPPITVDEALALAEAGALTEPRSITIRETAGEKFKRVIKYKLKTKPEFYPEPGWCDCENEEWIPTNYPDDDQIPF